MKRLFIILLTTVVWPCLAQQVLQVRWPSNQAAPPLSFVKGQNEWLPALRIALSTLPEETLVVAGLFQGQLLGLQPAEARQLQGLFATNYAALRQSPHFRDAPSALPYCFSERRPTNGLATVYLPNDVATKTPVIIFLHGNGGSLLVWLYRLSVTFPGHVIICPAYGVNGAMISQAYVEEARRAVASRLPAGLATTPLLVGLSAGGVAACQLYGDNPHAYRRVIALGAAPSPGILSRFDARSEARFIAGETEFYVRGHAFEKQMTALKSRTRSLEWKILPQAGHCFFLSHADETGKLLLEWAR